MVSRTTTKTGRLPAAIAILLVMCVLLVWSLGVFARDLRSWPAPALRTIDDYGTLALSDSTPDSGMSIGVLLRETPGIDALERLEYPADLSLLRDMTVARNGMVVNPLYWTVLEDMLAAKVVPGDYDPVLTQTEVEAALARSNTRSAGPTTLVLAEDDASQAYRIYTDPERKLYLVLPIEEAE